ncbi:Hypothetical predicted protein [Marmota monax]|uniref:Uncharacterized protein n=1 Tax=Marmota monax TaxID=9995 RepID=A0A5E4CJE9_MARMO|nr:Hypothetical predicted protein [Marmota monax]
MATEGLDPKDYLQEYHEVQGNVLCCTQITSEPAVSGSTHLPPFLCSCIMLRAPRPHLETTLSPVLTVINIIKPPVGDPKGFLQQHIWKDLEQLTKILGKSAEETTHVVHLMLCWLLKEQHPLPDQRMTLSSKGEIKLPKDYCNSDLDLDADFEVILSQCQGLGLCSTALVSYLIYLHNEIIHTLEKFSKENNSYSVDDSDVTDLHVVSYEMERDLIPLVLSNCPYQVVQGQETLQEFDLEKIQQQISSRFLQGKPQLPPGIPFGKSVLGNKADISPEIAKLLSTFLNHTDLDAFLMELHEMMVLKLRNTQTQDSFNPEWKYSVHT